MAASPLGRLNQAVQPGIQLHELMEVQRTGRLFYFS
jgi:hypothetical protein